jgi:hypothetical protein
MPTLPPKRLLRPSGIKHLIDQEIKFKRSVNIFFPKSDNTTNPNDEKRTSLLSDILSQKDLKDKKQKYLDELNTIFRKA